jgi:hypothetical protein
MGHIMKLINIIEIVLKFKSLYVVHSISPYTELHTMPNAFILLLFGYVLALNQVLLDEAPIRRTSDVVMSGEGCVRKLSWSVSRQCLRIRLDGLRNLPRAPV